MPTVNVEANLSSEQLLQAVKQMQEAELDTFADEVLAERAGRKAPHLSKSESDLLLTINQALSEEFHKRYEELIAKRQAESLTPAEHQELIEMGDKVERREADRIAALTTLAELRQTTLDSLMQELGLNQPTDD